MFLCEKSFSIGMSHLLVLYSGLCYKGPKSQTGAAQLTCNVAKWVAVVQGCSAVLLAKRLKWETGLGSPKIVWKETTFCISHEVFSDLKYNQFIWLLIIIYIDIR